MKKLKVLFPLILIIVLTFTIGILIILKRHTTLIIGLPFLSGAIVILTILFEGKIRGEEDKLTLPVKLTKYGNILISLYLLFTAATIFTTYQSIEESKDKSNADKILSDAIISSLKSKAEKDSLTSSLIISSLKLQAFNDSIKIAELKDLTTINGIKSDSIKNAVIYSAVKVLNEQSSLIEKQREINFYRFKTECDDNLAKILIFYKGGTVVSTNYVNELSHIQKRLSSTYLNEYIKTCQEQSLTDILTNLTERIFIVNSIIEQIINNKDSGSNKLLSENINQISTILTDIYNRLKNNDSYEEFELGYNIPYTFKPLSEFEEHMITWEFYRKMEMIEIKDATK